MTRDTCPVCESLDVVVVFRRPNVPVNQNIVFSTAREARAAAKRDIALAHCGSCDFVFNASFDESAVVYDERYDNAQLTSPTYAEYIDNLVRYLIEDRNLRHARIIEVGCGKGEFLRRLVEYHGSGVTGLGFDPSYTGPRSDFDGRLIIDKMNFGPAVEHLKADALLCRHVIEHIADPRAFLRSIAKAVADLPGVQFFLETPSIDWILENAAFWDIFYEHCNYWCARAMRRLFASAGLKVDAVRTIWRDQFLWVEGHEEGALLGEYAEPRSDLRARLAAFAHQESMRRKDMGDDMARRSGRVALWGASAKGVTLANLLDPAEEMIACLVDINPKKQSKFIAGSGHPIVAPKDLPDSIERIYVMNPNYLDECTEILASLGNAAQLTAV